MKGGPNRFPSSRPRDSEFIDNGPRFLRTHLAGQLTLPGRVLMFGRATNEDIIESAVNNGDIEPDEASATLAALAAMAIKTSIRPVE